MELEKYSNAYSYLVGAIRGMLSNNLGDKNGTRYDKSYESWLIGCFEHAIHYEGCQRYFLVAKDRLYTYNGRYYESEGFGNDMLQAIVKRVLHDVGVAPMYEQGAYRKIASNCLDAMRFEKASQFVPDRRYIVFRNCVLDTITRNIYNFDMRFQTDIVLDFDYAEKRSPLWDRVITQTIPNEEMAEAFQSFCGAFLTNRKEFSIEYVCYLIGRGRNGKSVVTGAIANMFGENLISNYSPQELFRDADKKYNRAGLVGKIANFSDDVTHTDFAGGMFKQFVSGHRISARNPYGRPFDLTEIPFMCCCVNELPPTSDNSLGHNRRILPIICPNCVSEKEADTQLSAKLATEEAKIGIFNWVWEGLIRLRQNNGRIVLGRTVIDAQMNAATESSSVYTWIRHYGVRLDDRFAGNIPPNSDKNWRTIPQWYEMYKTWCRMMGETPKPARYISSAFQDLGFPKRRDNKFVYYHALVGYNDAVVAERIEAQKTVEQPEAPQKPIPAVNTSEVTPPKPVVTNKLPF